jgi:YHS domain-containing protein
MMRWAMVAFVLAAGFSVSSLTAADAKPADPKPDDTKKDEPKKKDPKDMKADEANDNGLCPVCKGEFKPVYHYEYKGKEYHFRTRQCSKDFAADPTKFGAVGAEWKSPPSIPDPKPDPKKAK